MSVLGRAVCTALIATAIAAGPALAIRDLQGRDASVIRDKCTTRWGYGAPQYLQACIAMGIADYCNDGRSNTQKGTPVVIYDVDLPGHLPTPGLDHWFEWDERTPLMSFEAGWVPDSSSTKGLGRPLCLSKKRWATLPIDGPCPVSLPDPRKDQAARFCEDIAGVSVDALEVNNLDALRALRTARAFLFNKSAFLDAGLHLWTKHGALYTTTAGFDSGNRHRDDPPAEGYSPQLVGGSGDSLVGVVLTENLHWFVTNPVALPAESPLRLLGGAHFAALVTYQLPDGTFLTTTERRSEPRVRLEGFVFKTAHDAHAAATVLTPDFVGTPKPLHRYRRGSQLATSTQPPDSSWTAVRLEGWVLRAPTR